METDWDDAFTNGAYIAGADAFPAQWARDAAAFRARANGRLDIAYGSDPRQVYDLFAPADAPRGLFVFFHGGYWRAFDKSDWSHLAGGACGRGWAAALPSYPLCPQARIGEITRAAGRAIAAAARLVDGPIVIAGHSAGGHLAARMACSDAPLPPAVRARVRRVAPISGLFDLQPLLHTTMNATLRLDASEAAAESPALQAPPRDVDVVAWVGAAERPEFLRQTALIKQAWPATTVHAAPARHHFDVIDLLCDSRGAMVESMLAA